MEALRQTIRTYPVIDNHAHNLLLPDQLQKYDFLTGTTEAHGDALKDTRTSLSHIRAAKQLKELYGAQNDDWDTVMAARASCISHDYEALIKKCFEGTHTILMDDGLDDSSVQPYSWHDKFVTKPVKRIVRIEALAENILRSKVAPGVENGSGPDGISFKAFSSAVRRELQSAVDDPAVAGFKSVICYRTGLSVSVTDSSKSSDLNSAFEDYVSNNSENGNFRLESKALNDWLVRLTLQEISAAAKKGQKPKPIQFHTGLGDKDINLLLSDPSHLQPLIEEFPGVPFILLHSSYPYTRSAGYLTTVYSNAYLDLGEVFPMLSRAGQESAIRQALELVPGSKLLWSTDGHHFPETYWLANKQFRLALEKILCEYVQEGDLSAKQALQLAQDIFFNNSNSVYNLALEALDNSKTPTLPNGVSTKSAPASNGNSNDTWVSDTYDISLWEAFERENPTPAYIYLHWLDRMAQLRGRILPVKEFVRIIKSGGQISIARGDTGTLQNDGDSAVANPVGHLYIRPDLRSLRPTHKYDPLRKEGPNGQLRTAGTILSTWCDEDGNPVDFCHRGQVHKLTGDIKREFGVDFLVGFEIEITFLWLREGGKPYVPYVENQAWGTLYPEQWEKLSFFGEILDALEEMGLEIQQFHAESAPGQYEFVLPPLPPLAAIDTLIQVRVVIQQLAHKHGLRATLHPAPFPGIGTAAHAHISLSPPELTERFFGAGILEHIRAISAISMPQEASYDRVVDDGWTGGTWMCWGTQNREAPLRRVADDRWEVRCIDGTANMYLTIAALMAAGLIGMRKGRDPTIKDCTVNPSHLSDQERADLGITQRLSKKLGEALAALRADDELAAVLGKEMVSEYLLMKKAEQKMLRAMTDENRRNWLIERY